MLAQITKQSEWFITVVTFVRALPDMRSEMLIQICTLCITSITICARKCWIIKVIRNEKKNWLAFELSSVTLIQKHWNKSLTFFSRVRIHMQFQIVNWRFNLLGTYFASKHFSLFMSPCEEMNIINGNSNVWTVLIYLYLVQDLLICSLYDAFERITEPQISQMNCWSAWISSCFFSPCLSKNRFGHCLHATGLVGVWRLTCILQLVILLKFFPQVSHKYAAF